MINLFDLGWFGCDYFESVLSVVDVLWECSSGLKY
jgi:hypothetical protein